jgi:hypothetical protein
VNELTPTEKKAGKAFREASQLILNDRNRQDPPGQFAVVFHRVVRHNCPAAAGVSTGTVLREHYEESPEYWVCYCGAVSTWSWHFPHWDCQGGKVAVAAGQFAWIWKEGKCSGCGLVVRTKLGRFVIAADRPADCGRTRT